MISDRWRLAENVTVSVSGAPWPVLTVKPWSGTAEIRHTPPAPKRTVALPPSDGTVYTPDPPSSHPGSPPPADGSGGVARAVGVGVGAGVRLGSRVFSPVRVRDGVGPGSRLVADGLGERFAVFDAVGRGDAGSSSGADCATGAVGRVEPTTKWIVMMTAVTLAAVHDSQMIR
ncbi:hypothetical protein [Streptomyces sp. AC627_RSS907]|uniref:hypothetical protein n=1 Tax=Streptomyces sp. AC627_RSS907 TaxID=2823684 RepID=UPI0020B833E7|nr:hypothetical protein [Streptomyces sp. AC627_RSS907]